VPQYLVANYPPDAFGARVISSVVALCSWPNRRSTKSHESTRTKPELIPICTD
jgi:hypothetical protein